MHNNTFQCILLLLDRSTFSLQQEPRIGRPSPSHTNCSPWSSPLTQITIHALISHKTATHSPSHRLLPIPPSVSFRLLPIAPCKTDCSPCPCLLHRLVPMPPSLIECSSCPPLLQTASMVTHLSHTDCSPFPLCYTDCYLMPPSLAHTAPHGHPLSGCYSDPPSFITQTILPLPYLTVPYATLFTQIAPHGLPPPHPHTCFKVQLPLLRDLTSQAV